MWYINLFLLDLFDYFIFECSYSLGICKKKEKLLKTYLPNNFQVTFNVSRFQRLDTNSCGLFVLFCLIHRQVNLLLQNFTTGWCMAIVSWFCVFSKLSGAPFKGSWNINKTQFWTQCALCWQLYVLVKTFVSFLYRTFNLDTPYLELINSIFSADPTKNKKKITKFLSKWNQEK